MTTRSRRLCLITGASSGIGTAFAEVFAAQGWDLVITARRADRLEALATTLRGTYSADVHVIPADLSEGGGVSDLCHRLAERGLEIDGLVNNAGYGVPGRFTDPEWARHDAFLRVLVVALVELSYRLIPGMLERGYGRIINVASLAGLIPAPAGHTLYPGAKAMVVRFTEALAEETRGTGVHVTAVCPGFTHSEFHDVAGTGDQVRRLPGFMWMSAGRVAGEGYEAVMRGEAVYVPGRVNRTIARLGRWFPGTVAAVQRRISWTYRRTTRD